MKYIDPGASTTVPVFKLPQQIIDYLWECIDIAKKNPICYKSHLVGNISQSYKLEDPQNMMIPGLFDILHNPNSNPKMFEFINKELDYKITRIFPNVNNLEPHLLDMWVNFQKKGEFQPVHHHVGVFSFVIWMDIPYNHEDESKLPFMGKSPSHGGNFIFLTSEDKSRLVEPTIIDLSPKMNGYCCFFPSDLSHEVYPFYTSDKDRISISGNIIYR